MIYRLLKSPRFIGGILASCIYSILLILGKVKPILSTIFGLVFFVGLALGGRWHLIRGLVNSPKGELVIDGRQEWATAYTSSLALVVVFGFINNMSMNSYLIPFSSVILIAYSGSKLGCYFYKCCDWSPRYFTHKVSLPILEAIFCLFIGASLVLVIVMGYATKGAAIFGLSMYTFIRITSLMFRDEWPVWLHPMKFDPLVSATVLVLYIVVIF